MKRFWRQLEAQHSLAAVRQGWSVALGPAYESARAFLRDSGTKASEYPCPRGCGCQHLVVRHDEGDIVAACQCEDSSCPNLKITDDDTRVFELDEARLGRAIARGLECQPVDVALGVPRVRQIAALGYPPMPIVFTICHSPDGFLQTVTALVATLRQRFIVLTPSTRFVDARAQALLASVGAGFSDLEGILTLERGGRLSARHTAGELFSSYLPPQPEPMNRGEAERVFALAKCLEDGPKVTKAPLLRVFNLLVREGLSQREAARECDCTPSLVSKRVQAIEAIMKRPIEELRLLGRELGEMSTRPSSRRGGRTHRNRNDRDFGEEDG